MAATSTTKAHTNPVYGSYLADPFVWKHNETYYAIGTGETDAEGKALGKAFTVLQSADFYDWQFAANALLRPDRSLGNNFWAPEVAFEDGRFYLYYSVGHGDKLHQLRVAQSGSPQGPYRDMGITLVDPQRCPFAIDPHPFKDDDGSWYLFYARDFLETEGGRAGTALVMAPLERMTKLGEERVVLRAHADWQRFQENRAMYGRVWDWHTLEGPFVRKRNGQYYCFYSGGRWETENYGVDYGVAANVTGPYSDAGNEAGPRVLRSVPNRLKGPGHASIIAGPDGEDYIAFHAWNPEMTMRRMYVERLVWTGERPSVGE